MPARTGPVGVGVVGAGVISKTYLDNLGSFPDVELLAIGDLVPELAAERGLEHGVPDAGGVETVFDHPDVEIVVNLTIPAAHAEVAGRAVAAGKHVWNEKPLALDRASARALLDAADAAGVRVGCAPDTFLGAGWQATRRLVESGVIGRPLSALFLMQGPGPDRWHPNPAFLFQDGAGPLFDIGPYYLTAAVQLFGPATAVAGIGTKAAEQRTIMSGPRAGEVFDVTVPSQTASLTRFAGGQSLSMVLSFDSALSRVQLELTGTEGTLLLPDPNTFDGELALRRADDDDWTAVAATTEVSSRGTGVLDLARAVRAGTPHRASGALAYHVLDTMITTAESSTGGGFLDVASSVEVPALLPDDWDPKASTL